MKAIYILLIICLFFFESCAQTQNNKSPMKSYKYTNSLIHETSPYLLQHAHNPVNWHAWGPEALEKAKKENKLIIISIGYAACHWCHVMEHESFENEEVAEFMNANFIAIKIDREERPDIDQVYMTAVQLIAGRGGWPLNCIALPDGRPIYGGTYFPKNQWLDMLKQVSSFVKENPDKTENQAKSLTQKMQEGTPIYSNSRGTVYSKNDLNDIFDTWKQSIDYVNGGSKGAPKFPLPIGHQFLLNYSYYSENNDALKAVTSTLNKMADGGIYDQVGGGFSRYSVDEFWKVPHFEKMLYDNAQLVSLYSAAYQETKDSRYKIVVEETLEFLQRELMSKEGAFFSSLDADSEGEEGKFYVWTKNELQEILGLSADLIIDYYNVTEHGNWEEGKNILIKTESDKKIEQKYEITELELSERLKDAKKILLKERESRIRPGLDDKILTSWNALTIKAFVYAYRVFENDEYLKAAIKNADFINSVIKTNDNRLHRNYKNGKVSINAFLDDYAFTIEAFIELYQATFDEKWLNEAINLLSYTINHFYNNTSGMFYFTSDIDPVLITRKVEIMDNVIPAGNSQMAKNLFVLGKYFYNDDYIQKSEKMLNNVREIAIKNGAYFANWDILMTWFASEPYEVAIVGKDAEEKRKQLDKHYLPNVILSGGSKEGKLTLLKDKLIKGQTTIYVCQNKSCKLPVTEIERALTQINNK